VGLLKQRRIQTQILIAVACILVIMLAIIYSLYAQTSRIVLSNNNQYSDDLIRKFKTNVSQKVDEVGQIMLNLGFDPFLQRYMMQSDPSLLYELGKDLDRKIISLMAGRKGIEDIVLVGTNGTKYSLKGGIEYVRRFEAEIEGSKTVYVGGLEKFKYGGSPQDCLIFAQNIYSDNPNDGTAEKRIGYIAVIADVEAMFFDNDTTYAEPGVGFYLIDRYGRVFPEAHGKDVAEAADATAAKPETRVMTDLGGMRGASQLHGLAEIRASLLSFVPEEALLAEMGKVRTQSIVIVFLALVLMTLPFAVIVNNIVHPIQKLVKFINSIKSGGNVGEWKKDLKLEGNLEMRVVAEKLNGMLNEINQLTRRLVETTTHLLEAEIEKEKAASAFLRSQINPHFLYNTLESIRGVALEAEAPRVAEMTKALGKLFHYSIKGTGYVTLDRELNAVKSYVFLQEIRFEGRFDVVFDFDEDSLRAYVMKMILQPLVENAIFHGLEPKTTKGTLRVEGRLEGDDRLVIRVEDDGVGIGEERLPELRQRLAPGKEAADDRGENGRTEGSDGLGLRNVQKRLELAYGEGFGLSVESAAGQGTRMTVTMPVQLTHPGGDSDV